MTSATAQPWTPEVEISISLATHVIARQFPQLAPVTAEILGVGWDNLALVVNGQFVFRFPRRSIGATLLEREVRAMPAIASLLPVAVPDHRFAGKATNEFPWPFAGYEFIHGRTACRANLSDDQHGSLAAPLGQFLKALHHLPVKLEPDNLGRFNMPHRKQQAKERLAYVAKHGLVEKITPLVEIVDAAPMDYSPRADTPVHGDVYSRHLLVDESGRLSGVIDWGDVHLGDPATDLCVAFTFLPASARPAFFETYGAVEPIPLQIARFRAVYHTASVLHYAHQINDADLRRESQRAMRYTWELT